MEIHVSIQTHITKKKALFIFEILIVKTQEGTHKLNPKVH